MKLNSALSLVALGVISVLQVSSAQAASVYEIVNIEDFDLNGTLSGTQNGYGQSVNADGQVVGVSKGQSDLTDDDVESGNTYVDNNTGVEPDDSLTYTIYTEIVGNNFTFHSLENESSTPWLPVFESINGSEDPSTSTSNSVDSYFYDINDAGIRVGAMTAPQKSTEYTGDDDDYDYWYYRDYEMRGFVKDDADSTEVAIVPPYTTYTDDDDVSVNVGGWSVAAKINNNNLITGYAGTDISSSSETRIDNCISNSDDVPVDVCVQKYQFPNSSTGYRYIVYQMRAFVWSYADGDVTATQLPLGLDPGDSTSIFKAQGLGINDNGVVVGRSHVYRNDDEDDLYYDAAYWSQNTDGDYEYHWIPVSDDDVLSSKAVDINDSGIVVGSYKIYIDGYSTQKFFVYDTNDPDTVPTTPDDLGGTMSELNSYPKDINNDGLVVGSIETSHENSFDGPQDGFLYDVNTQEFDDLNDLMTCASKGYEQDSDGNWAKHEFTVSDSTGVSLTYNADIRIVEANKITEDGNTIVGTAFVRKPVYQTDDDGDLVLDDDGNPLFELDASGDAVTGYVPRMVVLQATNSGSACDVTDDSDDTDEATTTTDYERKGAAFWAWLLLLPLAWVRRRK